MAPQDVVVASVYISRLRKRAGLKLVPANWKRVVCDGRCVQVGCCMLIAAHAVCDHLMGRYGSRFLNHLGLL